MNKKYAGPPGTVGAIAADQNGSVYCAAHDHHGPPAAAVGQIGLAGPVNRLKGAISGA